MCPTTSKIKRGKWLDKNCSGDSRNWIYRNLKLKVTASCFLRPKHTWHLSSTFSNVISYSTQVGSFCYWITLSDLAAKEEERVWVKRQIDGELDDSRLTEGLTGESTVYKRRGMEKPEIGRPQIKCVPQSVIWRRLLILLLGRPKRIKFIFDLSASM